MLPEVIVLATRNRDKLTELQEVLTGLHVTLRSAYDFVELPDVDEDQDTLEGNALKKARVTFEATGLPSLSDDTGLEVDALDGRPGVYSARYAGEKASYQQNVDLLISELSALQTDAENERPAFSARFRTVIAYVHDRGEHVFHGVCEGEIVLSRRGANGFGYDPVFVPAGYNKTFAEMEPDLKNKISHRSMATLKFRDFLESGLPDS